MIGLKRFLISTGLLALVLTGWSTAFNSYFIEENIKLTNCSFFNKIKGRLN